MKLFGFLRLRLPDPVKVASDRRASAADLGPATHATPPSNEPRLPKRRRAGAVDGAGEVDDGPYELSFLELCGAALVRELHVYGQVRGLRCSCKAVHAFPTL